MELDITLAKAMLAAGDIFGDDYIASKPDLLIGKHIREDTIRYYLPFEGSERTDLTPNIGGWTVYAVIDVDRKTNVATVVDGVLPDGTPIHP